MNHISIIYIIKQTNGSFRWLHSASELILPGHHLATRIPEFQCLIRYVCFFILGFGLFYAKVLYQVFFWAFSESVLMQMCYFVFVFMHALYTLLSLWVCLNSQRNTKQWFKRPKPIYWLNVWQFEPIWARGVRLSVNYCSCLAQRDEMHWFLLMNQCCQNVMM